MRLELLELLEGKLINGMTCSRIRFGSMNDVMGGFKKGLLDGAGLEQEWMGPCNVISAFSIILFVVAILLPSRPHFWAMLRILGKWLVFRYT